MVKINKWLLPLSWIYGLGVYIRNLCFEMGILKSRSYDIPVIGVGNITVGGAGKTPHVEYLIELLSSKVHVAVLSRGYKRKTRGYVLASQDSNSIEIGDEPSQMKRKYPQIHVAVDRNRCHGIDRLTSDAETADTDVVLLDDAYQHRYVHPGINILLVDYNRLIIYDKLLPAGRLREPIHGKSRADIVIVTKCPTSLTPMDIRVLTKSMKLYPFQDLYFTTVTYKPMHQLFSSETKELKDIDPQTHILLLTAIASPQQMENDLAQRLPNITHIHFADHHNFSSNDIDRLCNTFSAMPTGSIIITTEKDAQRLLVADITDSRVRQSLYVLPIKIEFMLGQQEQFDQKILSYVHKNSKNSTLITKTHQTPKAKNNRIISFESN